MFDLFKRDSGKVYPSWQDNPHLVLARTLRNLPVGSRVEPENGVSIYRKKEAVFHVSAPPDVDIEFKARSHAASTVRLADLIEMAISEVIGWLIQYTEGTHPVTETQIPPLTTKAINALRAIAVDPLRRNHDGRTVHSLIARGFITEAERGRLALMPLGERALEDAEAPPAKRGGRKDAKLHEHIPDPDKALPAPPAAHSAPPPDDLMTAAYQHTDTTQDGRAIAAWPPPPAVVEPAVDVAADPARAVRILNYLMQNSPLIRDLVGQLDAVDRATEKLRSLD